MKQNIIHIGLDVDDTQYHGSAFNKDTGEVIDFKCRPTLKGLLNQLDKMAGLFPELLSNVVFGRLSQAATWSISFTSIPCLNSTPVITLAR